MIGLLTSIVGKLEGLVMALVNLKPVLLSEYVIEQTMKANLDQHWFQMMIPVSIILLVIGIVCNVIANIKGCWAGDNWFGGAIAGYILGGIALIVMAITYTDSVNHIINATTPTLQMTKDILVLL